MELFIRQKDWFAGVDSDGTAFDTMTVKHKKAFIPNIIEVWGLGAVRGAVAEVAEWINLTSPHRGINRFPGLAMTFDLLRQRGNEENGGIELPDPAELHAFVRSGLPLSNEGLADYLSAHPSLFLEQVLHWSRQSDRDFSEAAKALPPFPYVRKTLEKMSRTADLMVVSAASGAGLKEDWARADILSCMNAVAGQEFGSKAQQLAAAVDCGAVPERSLMIGDGLGDWEAAKANGMSFYPILPGRESACWQRLYENVWESFLSGSYGREEETYMKEFRAALGIRGEGIQKK